MTSPASSPLAFDESSPLSDGLDFDLAPDFEREGAAASDGDGDDANAHRSGVAEKVQSEWCFRRHRRRRCCCAAVVVSVGLSVKVNGTPRQRSVVRDLCFVEEAFRQEEGLSSIGPENHKENGKNKDLRTNQWSLRPTKLLFLAVSQVINSGESLTRLSRLKIAPGNESMLATATWRNQESGVILSRFLAALSRASMPLLRSHAVFIDFLFSFRSRCCDRESKMTRGAFPSKELCLGIWSRSWRDGVVCVYPGGANTTITGP